MKKLMNICLVIGLAITLVGCDSSSNEESAKDGAQEIVIGISPDYPPFDDITVDGELTGFDVDMAEWLFNWLNENGYNYTYKWNNMSFDTIISAIQADQVDLGVSAFTYDPERKVLFSVPYYGSAEVALVNADSDIKTVDDLVGKNIGAQQGATGETAANEIEGATVTSMQDMGIIVETLKTGGVDAVILDIAIANNYAKNGDFTVLDEALLDEKTHIIAKEGNDELMDAINKALEAFLESDAYQQLLEDYDI